MIEDARSAARATARVVKSGAVPPSAIGTVQRAQLQGTVGEAQLTFGFTPDVIPVTYANWSSSFTARVQAGTAAGRRVLVVFPDGQPFIVDTQGI